MVSTNDELLRHIEKLREEIKLKDCRLRDLEIYMDSLVLWTSCVKTLKEALQATFDKLSNGIRFQEIAETYGFFVDRFCPARLQLPTKLLLTFILFHVYLLYVLVFTVTKLLVTNTRIKGSRVIPLLPDMAAFKERIFVFLTSIFVFHWFSRSVLGISAGWEYITSWVVHLRPQINIKPQLKLVATESCHSNKSSMSVDLEQVSADVDVFLSPENKELTGCMKSLQKASDTASFASDLASSIAASITQSDSLESLGGFSAEDEVDIDEEMDKARALKVSATAGFRSRIPIPQALERFRIRNAIANSQLRQRFLKRSRSNDDECSSLLEEHNC
ncbi:hypothetical protein Q1695_011787 [Nippostrongylus brasiliensis]|nr:hypothetical protein Q1695_011787 [Nippostrongylus brasiliensis]